MAEYSKIYKKIWKNKKYRGLKDDQKFLFLYLLSSPHANTIGFYYLPKKYISSDLGWNLKKTAQNLKILFETLIKYDEENQIILISSWFKHNPIRSGNHVKKAQAELSEVSNNTPLYQEFIEIIKKMPDGLHKDIVNNAVSTPSERRSNYEEEEEKEEENKKASSKQNMSNNDAALKSSVNNFAGSGEPLFKKKKKIDEKTISEVRLTLKSRLFEIGYWNGSKRCKNRLDEFISKLIKEASEKDNPNGWFIKAAIERLNENLENFKPDRDEEDEISSLPKTREKNIYNQILKETLQPLSRYWEKPYDGLSEHVDDLKKRLDVASAGVVTEQEFKKLCDNYFDQIVIEKEFMANSET